MKYRRFSAIALAVMFGFIPSAWLVNAHEEPGNGVPVTDPGMVCPGVYDSSLTYAVYFADNMAFAPQWREGNLVRIETLVAKLYDYNGDTKTNLDDFPIELNNTMWDVEGFGPAGSEVWQSDLMADPDLLNYTCMVSVPEMLITIDGAGGPYYYYGLYNTSEDYVQECPITEGIVGEVGREVNKAGHLIYGFLWDTEADEAPVGDYKVSVWIPAAYKISVAMRTLYIVDEEPEEELSLETAPDEENEPMGFEPLPVWTGGDVTWTGGVDTVTNEAFIWIGELVERGGSSNDNGGNDDSGGDHENGNGGDGGGNDDSGGDHENGNGGDHGSKRARVSGVIH